MFPIGEFENRFREILASMDGIAEAADEADEEDLEELNAEFEDALLRFSGINPENDDAEEELDDALTELEALAGDYGDMAQSIPELEALARRLSMTVQMARNNAEN